jgi:cation transport regulator
MESQRETQPESIEEPPLETPQERKREPQPESDKEARADRGKDARYESIEDIPDSLRSTLPREAQEVYLRAYQESWDTYEEHQGGELGRAAVAHRDGWNVMSKQYAKHPSSGKWYPVDELPEDEEHEDNDEGLVGKIKDIF